GEGVTKDSLEYLISGTNLVFRNKESGETLTVQDWFKRADYKLNKIVFADGSELTASEVETLSSIKGTNGDDILTAVINNGVKIYGYEGNDKLYGGAGNDYLNGGIGDDIYAWGNGSGNDIVDNSVSDSQDNGNDTLIFRGLSKSNLQFEKNNNDLVFKNSQTQETITISNWMQGDQYKVQNFSFSDGTTLTSTDIDKKVQMLKDASLEVYAPLAADQLNTFIQDQANKLVIATTSGNQAKAS
ncbi:MAG: hypothetical protein LLG02_00330, partial [Pelosinus sp.]|nr:hypothetical protein [Pelosinus sp.]